MSTRKQRTSVLALMSSQLACAGVKHKVVTASSSSSIGFRLRGGWKAVAFTPDHWTKDPAFVTQIEKAKAMLRRVVEERVSCEDFDADVRFDTGFKVTKLPAFAESALVIELPGHVSYEPGEHIADAVDPDGAEAQDIETRFSIKLTIAPRAVSALWRPGEGLRERGKYGGVVTITTGSGTVKRPIQFIHQNGQLASMLSHTPAVVELMSGAVTDAFYESVTAP